MPQGKPAGVRCIQLTDDNQCKLFGKPERPTVCVNFKADIDICGSTNEEAFRNIQVLEMDSE